jgi:hypothetical protein
MMRIGGFFHRSEFRVAQARGEHTQQLQVYKDDPFGNVFYDNALGWMIGAGVNIGSKVSLEYTYYPKAGGPVSPYQDISSIMLSFRLAL